MKIQFLTAVAVVVFAGIPLSASAVSGTDTSTGTGTGTATDTGTGTSTATETSITFNTKVDTAYKMADAEHNPDKQEVLKSFDWQANWGSIHINSYADGVGDPGSPATSNGQVACNSYTAGAGGKPKPNICFITNVTDPVTGQPAPNPSLNAYPPSFEMSGGKFPSPTPITVNGKTVLTNGIKYDIKNSVVNCMSKAVPNWAIKRGGPSGAYGYQVTVCNKLATIAGVSMSPNYDLGAPSTSNYAPKLYFFPFYDSRSNDPLSIDDGAPAPGCMQQITNTCGNKSKNVFVRDIHDCFKTNTKYFDPDCPNGTQCDQPGYAHPVTHIFSPEEVADLGLAPGAPLPRYYWSFDKKDTAASGGHRIALSATDPQHSPDRYKGVGAAPIKFIENVSDPKLARLKAFQLDVKEYGSDNSASFTIMDPSDFFDLNLYVAGGKYDSGFEVDEKTKLPQTPDTCPIVGGSGYGGICDPTGKAGCNLPFYGIGPTTEFQDADGNAYTYSPATVKWSGYVKSWQVISKDTYLKETKGKKISGDSIYLEYDEINDNPIIKITRSNDYCEDPEMMSAAVLQSNPPRKPDLSTCTQYLQYQQTDEYDNVYSWVDLYFPPPDEDPMLDKPRMDLVHLYHQNPDGTPNFKKPVTGGSGPNGEVTMMDDAAHRPNVKFTNANGEQVPAVMHVDSITTREGYPTVGHSLNPADPKDLSLGVGMELDRGVNSIIRTKEPLEIGGKETTCAFIDVGADPNPQTGISTKAPKVFVPTNSQAEVQHFIDGLIANGEKNGVKVRNCAAKFAANTKDGMPLAPDGSNKRPDAKGLTWHGKISCAELVGNDRPACNQTRRISLERMCQYENGMFADCDSCDGVKEPEDKSMYSLWDNFWKTGEAPADMDIMVAPMNSGTKGDRCRFLASCFAISSEGGACPSAGTIGGHVFCLSGDTKITMADGTEKAIKSIKAGEKVKAFDAKNSRNMALGTAKVKATAITKKQKIVKINNLRITPLHKIVLANGRAVEAQNVKVGDKILKDTGLVEEVTKVEKSNEPITVYNLVLDNTSDGYIAGGLRVMSYPTPKGMDAVAKAKKAEADARKLSSQKANH